MNLAPATAQDDDGQLGFLPLIMAALTVAGSVYGAKKSASTQLKLQKRELEAERQAQAAALQAQAQQAVGGLPSWAPMALAVAVPVAVYFLAVRR